MKKNVLSLSIAAAFDGFAGVSQATVFAADSNGHLLVVPYYTVQDGNMHALHAAPPPGKPVKIRFRGAGHADDAMDFRVFLGPGDSWAQEPPVSAVADCSLPRGAVDLQRMGRAFRTERLNGN